MASVFAALMNARSRFALHSEGGLHRDRELFDERAFGFDSTRGNFNGTDWHIFGWVEGCSYTSITI